MNSCDHSSMRLLNFDHSVVVSISRGTPISTPTYYNPSPRTPQKVPRILGNPEP